MRAVPPWVAALIVAASACQAGTDANLVDVNGVWTFTERFEDKAHGISCADTGTYHITQAGDRFSGVYGQRGICITPSGAVDNADSGTISGGRVVGHTVHFMVTMHCEYEGSASGMPAAQLMGRGACVLQDIDRTLNFSGTWSARR